MRGGGLHLRRRLRHLVIAISIAGVAAAFGGTPQNQPDLSALFRSHHLKQGIFKPASGILKHPYLVPSGPYYQLFDWDTYFMGVALSYDGKGKPLASSVLDFLELVNTNANDRGYVPREIAPDALWALPEQCKPFLAQAAVRASQTMGGYRWIEPYYQKLADTLHFWEAARRSSDGLFRWFNGVESGTDNNPAVSDNPAVTTEGVDLACYIAREYQAMALIAAKLGRAGDAARYNAQAGALRDRIRTKMWSARDSMFFDINSRTGQFVRVKTWTDFVPLWARIATPAQAKATIEKHLLNPKEFWSPYGVRTLAATEPLYNASSGYWRGPVWVISNYLVMHGLMNYGYRKQAIELAEKTERMLADDIKKTGGMNECYNPQTGAPTAGGHFLSWDLLGEHMIEEAEKNRDPTALK